MSGEQRNEPQRLLQLIQQRAGVSRRKAQALIASGEVALNGAPETNPFAQVNVTNMRSLTLRGHPLALEPPEPRIYRYHKPRDVLCSHDDRFDGNTVGRILRAEGFMGYTWAGRLDRDAEGLLLVTNEGGLVQVFTHPSHQVRKVYRVWVKHLPKADVMRQIFEHMRSGVADDEDILRILAGRVEGRPAYATVTLTEGRKHEVKRLFAHFGLPVMRLLRVAIGPVDLGELPVGKIARLSPAEEEAVLTFARSRLDGN